MADYVIGGFLFLIAIVLFLSIVFRPNAEIPMSIERSEISPAAFSMQPHSLGKKLTAFAVLVLVAAIPGIHAIQLERQSLVSSVRNGIVTPQDLDNMMPKQLGEYQLVRAWQEETGGSYLMESAAYKGSSPDEVTLGVWLPTSSHNIHYSLMARGESPQMRTDRAFAVSQGRIVFFDTALYSDGITDRIAAAVDCTPSDCRLPVNLDDALSWKFRDINDFTPHGTRWVSLFFSIERPHAGTPKEIAYREMSEEAQRFLNAVSLNDLSKRFQ